VWAHPFWDIEDPARTLETLRAFAAAGVDGVEAFYVTHDADQTRLLHDAAAELKLLTTGSSDFHGPQHRIFARFLAHELHGLEPRLGPLLAG
jgi:predicted metal-dependent phosphoesterase TrpH